MSAERIWYEAERFLTAHRSLPVDRRLAFDAWTDRRGFDPDEKRRLWSTVKAIARRRSR
jgi:hypothetical protein